MHSATIANGGDARQGNWYAVYTKHQHEKVVARSLAYKGFEIFLPLYASTRTWKDRVKLLYLPLFPCYVFFKGDVGRRLDIITTPGIHALVSNSDQPAAIPAAEIEGIGQAVRSGVRVEPHPFLKIGDWVRVKCGPLAGVQGILVRKKDIYRLVLSVEMLGQAASVEVDAVLLDRLNGKPSAAYDASRSGTRLRTENRNAHAANSISGGRELYPLAISTGKGYRSSPAIADRVNSYKVGFGGNLKRGCQILGKPAESCTNFIR